MWSPSLIPKILTYSRRQIFRPLPLLDCRTGIVFRALADGDLHGLYLSLLALHGLFPLVFVVVHQKEIPYAQEAKVGDMQLSQALGQRRKDGVTGTHDAHSEKIERSLYAHNRPLFDDQPDGLRVIPEPVGTEEGFLVPYVSVLGAFGEKSGTLQRLGLGARESPIGGTQGKDECRAGDYDVRDVKAA